MSSDSKTLTDRFFQKTPCNPFAVAWSSSFLPLGVFTLHQLYNLPLPPELQPGGHSKYLTNLGFLATMVYFAFQALYQLFKLEYFVDTHTYLSVTATSVEFVIVIAYWGLKLYDEDLVQPPDVKTPPYLDVLLHIVPFCFLVVDYFCFSYRWDSDNRFAFSLMCSLTFFYWCWLDYLIGVDSPAQPYPFLNVPIRQRIVIFCIVGLVGYCGYLILKYLHPPTPTTKEEKTE